MTFPGTAMTRLADYRDEMLHNQSPAETRRMQQLGGHLRRLLKAARLSRQQFAERTGLALELIVALENGYGRPETARRVLRLAQAWRDSP